MTRPGYLNPYRGSPEGLNVQRAGWFASAACRGVGPDLFFDNDKKALTYCYRCPVHQECSDYAHHNNLLGTWGGVTEQQRRSGVRYRPELPEPSDDEVFMSARIKELHRQGVSWTQIQRVTGVHPRNISRILQRRYMR